MRIRPGAVPGQDTLPSSGQSMEDTGISCQSLWVSIQISAAPIIFCSLVCNRLICPGIAPGIPDKNAYKPQGKGVMGGLGISGQSTQVAAFPAATAAALVIFLMFLMLFITFSFLSVHDRPVTFGLGNKKAQRSLSLCRTRNSWPIFNRKGWKARDRIQGRRRQRPQRC